MTSPTTAELWRAAGEDWRAVGIVSVDVRLLLGALTEIHELRTHLASAQARVTRVENDRYAAQTGFGGCQVERDRLRCQLAAVLEIAEDRGVNITDDEVAAQIAATRRSPEDLG